MSYSHISILREEIVSAFEYLADRKAAVFIDGTLGLAGHAISLARAYTKKNNLKIIGIDKDVNALIISKSNIRKSGLSDVFTLVHQDYTEYNQIIDDLEILAVDGILLDLGISSMQIDDKSRGFSFSDPTAPLDMRMNREQLIDAKYIVNKYSQQDLEIILKNGEERYFRKIAKEICHYRINKNIDKTGDLIEIVEKCVPKIFSGTHIATNTFRALRLEVNDEISKLEKTIDTMAKSLKIGSKFAIISFHSLEDRIVKNKFKQLESPCTCHPQAPICTCNLQPIAKLLTKKPIIPSENEIGINHRSRSAKLRIIQKI